MLQEEFRAFYAGCRHLSPKYASYVKFFRLSGLSDHVSV